MKISEVMTVLFVSFGNSHEGINLLLIESEGLYRCLKK